MQDRVTLLSPRRIISHQRPEYQDMLIKKAVSMYPLIQNHRGHSPSFHSHSLEKEKTKMRSVFQFHLYRANDAGCNIIKERIESAADEAGYQSANYREYE